MKHPKSARVLANKRGPIPRILSVLLFVNLIASAHSGDVPSQNESHFIDPSAIDECHGSCSFGSRVYVGPFAKLKTGLGSPRKTPLITIGNDSNVQDNALLDTTRNNKRIALGERVIIAHGAFIYGGAEIGVSGPCSDDNPPVCDSFVGFNSDVEDAVVQRNAMVTHLARVGPGVTIPSGRVVLPGVNITSNSEVPAKTVEITEADHEFMEGVINVNIALTAAYNELARQPGDKVRGINVNPRTDFTPRSVAPTLDQRDITDPNSPHRIIGDVRFSGTALPAMGANVSVRADEGTPFTVRENSSLASFTTFHALKDTKLNLGANGRYGVGSLMHGGKFNNKVTSTGTNFVLGNNSVFYSSTAADNCHIGDMSFVADTDLKANTEVPAKVVVLAGTRCQVEWVRAVRTNPTSSRAKRKR